MTAYENEAFFSVFIIMLCMRTCMSLGRSQGIAANQEGK